MSGRFSPEWIGAKAKYALLEEVYTAPKPGLVDPYSNGAHQDMDLTTFEKSAASLEPYFEEMARLGMKYWDEPELLFKKIRKVGVKAEYAMFQATDGINTHKGAIFTIGILSAAAGACLERDGRLCFDAWIAMEQEMVSRILREELRALSGAKCKVPMTHGQGNLIVYGSLGIRGEAFLGYPSVVNLALPVLIQGKQEGRDWNLVKLQTLFTLMSQVEDGNVLARTGREGLKEVQEIAGQFLENGGAYQAYAVHQLWLMDEVFIEKNYSNGGCADLMAAAVFMEMLERESGA